VRYASGPGYGRGHGGLDPYRRDRASYQLAGRRLTFFPLLPRRPDSVRRWGVP